MPELPGTPSGLISAEWIYVISVAAAVLGTFWKVFSSSLQASKEKVKETATFESPPAQWPSPQAVFSFIEMGQSLDAIVRGVADIKESQQSDRRRHSEHIQVTETTQRATARLEDDMERLSREVQNAISDMAEKVTATKAMVAQLRDATIVAKKEGGS